MHQEEVLFSGGINNTLAPHFIDNSQGQYVSNCKISTGQLVSAKEPKLDGNEVYSGDNAIYYKAKDEVVASNEDRFYIEWAGFLYWSNSAGILKRYDGTDILDIGNHVAPAGAPSVVKSSSGLLVGEYTYCYTYLHEEAFESAPSDMVVITAVTNEKVTVTFGDTPPASATHRLVYRSGGLNPTFNKVDKILISEATYVDNTSDFLISRDELNTGTNDAPPPNLDMLVETGGTLYGAVGNEIHFSRAGQPEYWSNYNYVEVPTQVTGLGVVGGSVVAFTEENMYMLSGSDIYDMQIVKLPYSFGCKDKRTVQSIKGKLVWLSAVDEYDLVCAFDGAGVTILNQTNQLITSTEIGSHSLYDSFTIETYDNYFFDIKGSIAIGRKYYLFLTGRTVIVDFEDGIKTYYMKETVDGSYEKHNQLFIIADGAVYNYLTSSTQRDVSYLTKELSNGELTREKAYRKMHINGAGKWTITVKIDRRPVFKFDYSQGHTIHLPAGLNGKTISFDISSDGYCLINAMSYEYEYLEHGYPTVLAPLPECEESVGGIDGNSYYAAFKWSTDCSVFKK